MFDDVSSTEIKSVAGFVDLVSALRDEWGARSWWRGESAQSPTPLVPKVLRDGRWSQIDKASMMITFMKQAPSRRADLPNEKDFSSRRQRLSTRGRRLDCGNALQVLEFRSWLFEIANRAAGDGAKARCRRTGPH